MNVKELVNPGAAVGVFVYGLGYGIGFFSAYHILKKQFEERYAQELSEELEKTRAFYKILHKKDVSPEELVTFDDWDDEEALIEAEAEEVVEDILEDYAPTQTTEEAVAVVQTIIPGSRVIKTKSTVDDVREITRDDVRYLSDDFENVELTFFREDGVLCHEDGGVIYHPEMVIGIRQFKALDDIPPEQSRVYLLSEEQSKLWMIDMEPGNYASTYIQHSAREHPLYKGPKKFRVNDE